MNPLSIAITKLAGIRVAVLATLKEEASPGRLRTSFRPENVGHYFQQAAAQVEFLREQVPELFGDFQPVSMEPMTVKTAPDDPYYTRSQLSRLLRDIEHVFELRASSGDGYSSTVAKPFRRVFITHGRSQDWREVQSYIEKDIELNTVELAQEPNLGMTVIEKLVEHAERCDSAVIVMTGDDIDEDGLAKARENVMHEIGFFQGKYGRSKVVLLHEEGVNIPSNLSGVVYVSFPKRTVSAGFHVLSRELKAIYRS